MPEKTVREIFFDPRNMACTFIAGIMLGFILVLTILFFRQSPDFYLIILAVIVVFNCLFITVIKYNIDDGKSLKKSWEHFKIFLKQYYDETAFSTFNKSDWINFIFGLIILVAIGFLVYITYTLSFEVGIKLLGDNLSANDRADYENIRAMVFPALGLFFAFFLFCFNSWISIPIEAKQRKNNEDLHKKLDRILEKLDNFENFGKMK